MVNIFSKKRKNHSLFFNKKRNSPIVFLKKNVTGWIFILPTIVGIGLFVMYPIIQSIMYSFHEYDMLTVYNPIGLKNYIKVFTDPASLKALTNTVFFCATNIPMVLVLTFVLSLLLNINIPGMKAFRVMYYLPSIIPAIAGGILWSNLMKYGYESPGIFNKIRLMLGLDISNFFYADGYEAIASILLMNLWTIGGGTIIWLAAFKDIPRELYEAADIDGANRAVKLFKITIPQSAPLMLYNLVTLTIVSVQFNGTIAFAPNIGAGTNDSTLMLGVKIYKDAFTKLDVGYAAATSWVLMIITALLTLLMFKVSRKVGNDD